MNTRVYGNEGGHSRFRSSHSRFGPASSRLVALCPSGESQNHRAHAQLDSISYPLPTIRRRAKDRARSRQG
eukprot:5468870-Pleurochrysis_carterae.AAC.1